MRLKNERPSAKGITSEMTIFKPLRLGPGGLRSLITGADYIGG